ncbi:conserved protein of unknown function [Burkholderia multivorans]
MESSDQMRTPHPRSVELYNDDTHDSTVDTDGKNREAARVARGAGISPDQVTTSNASLVNAVPEASDGLAGFDSRAGGNHPALALREGYEVIEKGFDAPQRVAEETIGPVHRMRGREHWPGHARRPERIIELTTVRR